MDFGNNTPTAPLAVDPAYPEGQNVEPELIPALDATADRLGIYGTFGDTEQASLVDQSAQTNKHRAEKNPPDALAHVLRALRALDNRRLYIGPFVWTVNDNLIRGILPIDRLPINATLYRAIALLTDASTVANEVITITDLLSVPIRLNPTRDISTQQSVYPVIDLPFKTEGFAITKQGGGNFTSQGALWLDIREVNLV